MIKLLHCLAIMPIGPRSNVDYALDTADSFLHYFTDDDVLLLILDDTRSNKLLDMAPRSSRVKVISVPELSSNSPDDHNTRGRLFLKQVMALRLLASEFRWRCLLRLDDDALIIGPNPHFDALEAFAANKDVGILGAYLRRGDGQDKRPALRKQGRRLIKRVISGDIVRNPKLVATLLYLIVRAKLNGYTLGHMCTGGSLFVSGGACEAVERRLGCHLKHLVRCDLADDLLLALCVAASGYKLKDFSDAEHIMAINWRGLPMPLAELTRHRKKIVHPVKEPSDESHEPKVRRYFRDIRVSERPEG